MCAPCTQLCTSQALGPPNSMGKNTQLQGIRALQPSEPPRCPCTPQPQKQPARMPGPVQSGHRQAQRHPTARPTVPSSGGDWTDKRLNSWPVRVQGSVAGPSLHPSAAVEVGAGLPGSVGQPCVHRKSTAQQENAIGETQPHTHYLGAGTGQPGEGGRPYCSTAWAWWSSTSPHASPWLLCCLTVPHPRRPSPGSVPFPTHGAFCVCPPLSLHSLSLRFLAPLLAAATSLPVSTPFSPVPTQACLSSLLEALPPISGPPAYFTPLPASWQLPLQLGTLRKCPFRVPSEPEAGQQPPPVPGTHPVTGHRFCSRHPRIPNLPRRPPFSRDPQPWR